MSTNFTTSESLFEDVHWLDTEWGLLAEVFANAGDTVIIGYSFEFRFKIVQIVTNFVDGKLGFTSKFPIFACSFLPEESDFITTGQEIVIRSVFVFGGWENGLTFCEVEIADDFSNAIA